MPNVSKIAIPVLLVAAAYGAYYMVNIGGASNVAAPSPNQNTATKQQEPKGEGQAPQIENSDPVPVDLERTEAKIDNYKSHADAPQGVKGRVLLPNGQPAAGVSVMLLANAMNNPIDMFLKNKAGQVSPPLSSAVTLEDGSFALGILRSGKSVDLRVSTDEFPELGRSPIKVRAEDWYDAGDLQLKAGLVVQGRVIESVSKLGISNATVYMNPSNRLHAMSATPGRERGTAAITDGNGYFRFTNGPDFGLINLEAEKEGYATSSLSNKQIKSDSSNEFTLAIERGRTITGVVIDDSGKRIQRAKIQAIGLSSKTPQNETIYSDRDGEFMFPALRSGPYKLTCSASNFADATLPLALTDEDVKIVLAKRGTLKLRVLSAKNRPIKSYRLSLKRAFPNNPANIGNVFDFADRNINASDYQGKWAIIEGLPAGSFRVQLSERNHAKTLSEMFVLEESGDPVEVTAVMTTGGAITGMVIDNFGEPVSGATVTSDMNQGIAAQSGLFSIFKNMIPQKHTTRSVRTNKEGKFRINSLSFADYMVRVTDPRFCEGTAIGINVSREGEVVDTGAIQLQLGTRIEGFTRLDGNPTGQIKVTISLPNQHKPGDPPPKTPTTPEEIKAAAKRLFNATALSDGNGQFVLLKRVPPGVYKVTAARQSQASPFTTLLDMKQTERELVLSPGQDLATLNFSLSSR